MTHQLAVGGHHEILAVVSHHTTQAGEFLSAHRGYRITFPHQTPDIQHRLQTESTCNASSGGDWLTAYASCVLLSLCYTS